jgi:hypothetical protein
MAVDASDQFSMIGRRALTLGLAGGLVGSQKRDGLTQTQASAAVDLQLVLAVDSSSSVNAEEFATQMEGFAAAFRDPKVAAAVDMGAEQAVAITLFEWASPYDQALSLPWTRLAVPEDFQSVAYALENAPRGVVGGGTSISGALLYALALFETCPFPSTHRTIDVSGDGRNNQGFPVSILRDRIGALGIGINGLAILNEEPDLLRHYQEDVIVGPNAFALPAESYGAFSDAMLLKLLRELTPPATV